MKGNGMQLLNFHNFLAIAIVISLATIPARSSSGEKYRDLAQYVPKMPTVQINRLKDYIKNQEVEKLKKELSEIDRLYSRILDEEVHAVAIARLLVKIRNPENRIDENLKQACNPYVLQIITKDLKSPVRTEIIQAQIQVFASYINTFEEKNIPDRKYEIELFIKIWKHVYETWESYSKYHSQTDEIEYPQFPESLKDYTPGVSSGPPPYPLKSDALRDPLIRKQYEQYVNKCAEHSFNVGEYHHLESIRKLYLPQARGYLRRRYNNQAKSSEELNEIVCKVMKDKNKAQRVFKELTE